MVLAKVLLIGFAAAVAWTFLAAAEALGTIAPSRLGPAVGARLRGAFSGFRRRAAERWFECHLLAIVIVLAGLAFREDFMCFLRGESIAERAWGQFTDLAAVRRAAVGCKGFTDGQCALALPPHRTGTVEFEFEKEAASSVQVRIGSEAVLFRFPRPSAERGKLEVSTDGGRSYKTVPPPTGHPIGSREAMIDLTEMVAGATSFRLRFEAHNPLETTQHSLSFLSVTVLKEGRRSPVPPLPELLALTLLPLIVASALVPFFPTKAGPRVGGYVAALAVSGAAVGWPSLATGLAVPAFLGAVGFYAAAHPRPRRRVRRALSSIAPALLAGLLVFSLDLRWDYFEESAYSPSVTGDAAQYRDSAVRFAEIDGRGGLLRAFYSGSFWIRPPGFILAARCFFDLLGESDLNLRLLTTLLSTGLVYLSYLVGSRMICLPVGLATGLLVACNPFLCWHAPRGLRLEFFASLVLLLFYAIFHRGRAGPWRRAVCIGLAAGFAVLTRTTALPLALLLMGVGALANRVSWRRALASFGLFVLLVLPWFLRMAALHHDPFFASNTHARFYRNREFGLHDGHYGGPETTTRNYIFGMHSSQEVGRRTLSGMARMLARSGWLLGEYDRWAFWLGVLVLLVARRRAVPLTILAALLPLAFFVGTADLAVLNYGFTARQVFFVYPLIAVCIAGGLYGLARYVVAVAHGARPGVRAYLREVLGNAG